MAPRTQIGRMDGRSTLRSNDLKGGPYPIRKGQPVPKGWTLPKIPMVCCCNPKVLRMCPMPPRPSNPRSNGCVSLGMGRIIRIATRGPYPSYLCYCPPVRRGGPYPIRDGQPVPKGWTLPKTPVPWTNNLSTLFEAHDQHHIHSHHVQS